jgi:anti-sigma28 factor (negative regulator of flagellin synthesis)
MKYIKIAFPFYRPILNSNIEKRKARKTANKRSNKKGTRKQKHVNGGENINLSVNIKNVSVPIDNITNQTKVANIEEIIRSEFSNKMPANILNELDKRKLYVKLTTESDSFRQPFSQSPPPFSQSPPPFSQENYNEGEMAKMVGAAIASILSNKQSGGARQSVYDYICDLKMKSFKTSHKTVKEAFLKSTFFDSGEQVSDFDKSCKNYQYKNQYIRLDGMNIDFTILNLLNPEYAFL